MAVCPKIVYNSCPGSTVRMEILDCSVNSNPDTGVKRTSPKMDIQQISFIYYPVARPTKLMFFKI
jgi:hypothetical protein